MQIEPTFIATYQILPILTQIEIQAFRQIRDTIFGPGSAVFHAVSGLSQLSPPLLLPGCGGPTPRAVAGRSDSQLPD